MSIDTVVGDYRILEKRIRIEYDVRTRGGAQADIHRTWDEHGVGLSGGDDTGWCAAVLAVARHPMKSVRCMLDYCAEHPIVYKL